MRLVVLGGGESGVGTYTRSEKGYDVFVSDFGKIRQVQTSSYKLWYRLGG
jgi:hypothetical protein